MKYRKLSGSRVLYDLSDRRQEEIAQYQGFLEIADAAGFQVVAVSDRFEAQVRRMAIQEQIDAVVGNFISSLWLKELPDRLIRIHMGHSPLDNATPSVCWDFAEIGKKVRHHLVEAGYPKLHYFAPQEIPEFREGLDVDQSFRTVEALRGHLSGEEPVAVVSSHDATARRLMSALKALGIPIPESVGITGVGNRSLESVLTDGMLTSVTLPFQERGRQIGRLLQMMLQGGKGGHILVSPGAVIPRGSTRLHQDASALRVRVEEWLLPNLQNPPPVEEWARRCGMSRRSFERAFRSENGVTPYEYLLKLRETEAKRLLRETDWTLAQIGLQIGIPDPPRFSAFFKKRTGIAASRWRKGSSSE